MEIIVNDTNIFIDLHSIGLLRALCDLPYDVRTVDFVVNEIKDPTQLEYLTALVTEGKIKVETFNIEELAEIIAEHSIVPGNLSIPDCSVCYYARKHSATLLTGDRQLRKYAENNNVAVRGVLFIFDELGGPGAKMVRNSLSPVRAGCVYCRAHVATFPIYQKEILAIRNK